MKLKIVLQAYIKAPLFQISIIYSLGFEPLTPKILRIKGFHEQHFISYTGFPLATEYVELASILHGYLV